MKKFLSMVLASVMMFSAVGAAAEGDYAPATAKLCIFNNELCLNVTLSDAAKAFYADNPEGIEAGYQVVSGFDFLSASYRDLYNDEDSGKIFDGNSVNVELAEDFAFEAYLNMVEHGESGSVRADIVPSVRILKDEYYDYDDYDLDSLHLTVDVNRQEADIPDMQVRLKGTDLLDSEIVVETTGMFKPGWYSMACMYE